MDDLLRLFCVFVWVFWMCGGWGWGGIVVDGGDDEFWSISRRFGRGRRGELRGKFWLWCFSILMF